MNQLPVEELRVVLGREPRRGDLAVALDARGRTVWCVVVRVGEAGRRPRLVGAAVFRSARARAAYLRRRGWQALREAGTARG